MDRSATPSGTAARTDRIMVVGAGIAGAMMALMLGRRGLHVDLYEKRGDFRTAHAGGGGALGGPLGQSTDAVKRSINLALSSRGQESLRAVQLLDAVMATSVPMPDRALHLPSPTPGGATPMKMVPYGAPGQALASVSRGVLNKLLLDGCDALPNVVCYFNADLSGFTADGSVVVTLPGAAPVTLRPALIVGADGAYSTVRTAMLRFGRMDFHREYIDHGYKELEIPAGGVGGGDGWAMPHPHALHIWPRGEFMLIALPNPDCTFTLTLFLPWSEFDVLDGSPDKVASFFDTHFPDAAKLMPDLTAQFARNPTSALVMTRAAPWCSSNSRYLLIGDAAHSVVPFYGQGANAAMEDCLVFTEELSRLGGDLSAAVASFATLRRPACEALAALSLDNYITMRKRTASPLWRARHTLDSWLHWAAPTSWQSLYSLVAFTRTPYHEALARAASQDAWVDGLLAAGGVALTAALVAGWRMWKR